MRRSVLDLLFVGIVVLAVGLSLRTGSAQTTPSAGGAFLPNSTLPLSGIFLNNKLLLGNTPPTISSGFGTAPTVSSANGNATFRINVGTGGTASTGVVSLTAVNPRASTGWNCVVNDTSAPAGKAMITKVTSSTATTVSVTGYLDNGVAAAWNSAATLIFACAAY